MDTAPPSSFAPIQKFNPGSILDDDPTNDMELDDPEDEHGDRLIIAVDFGTTFSSVAYAWIKGTTPRNSLGLTDIKCIARYPDDRPPPRVVSFAWEPREDVPTELWYSVHPTISPRKLTQINTQAPEQHPVEEDGIESDASSDLDSIASVPDNEGSCDEDPHVTKKELESTAPLFWGFGVQKQLKAIDIPKDGTRRLARFKLMLDKTSATEKIRAELGSVLTNLKKSKVIMQDEDVIKDYLHRLFNHTKHELQILNEYDDRTPIEFVLCVPALWSAKACRVMQNAMSMAAELSGLGKVVKGSLDNLFIISEPEAAAACVLEEEASSTIYANETILILDAGGGTVDAICYQVTNAHPLRFSAEVVPPGTSACGSSFINEAFEAHLLRRLRHETYLVKNGKTIKSIVEGKVIEFENGEKREIDTCSQHFEMEPIYIDDLQQNTKRKLKQNRIEMSKSDMRKVFREPLDDAAKLLTEQLELVKEKGFSVQKVILIGGFGQSPALRSHLRGVIAKEKNLIGEDIHFLTPQTTTTAVARGAVLRAFNKDYGPSRVTSCSYGFLRTEPYAPQEYAAHRNTRCDIDKADGERYINHTIDWLIQKGESLPHNTEYKLRVKHTFLPNKKRFLCEEVLYVSDLNHESHYRRGHVNNKGAEIQGSIIADMTFLRDRNLIQPVKQSEFSTYTGSKAEKTYWAVEFELVMIIDGRNLRYEARWPPSDDSTASIEPQQVCEVGQICIAAAFKPGTA